MSDTQLKAMAALTAFAKPVGPGLTRADKEAVAGQVMVGPARCTAGGRAPGGSLMTLADCVGANVAFLSLLAEPRMTTTERETNLISVASMGTGLRATAAPVSVGRRRQVWQTRIETQAVKPVALISPSQMTL